MTNCPIRFPAALTLLAGALLAAGQAQAQGLKAGLWEHRTTMKSDSGQVEKGMTDMKARMDRMPPEQRKMIEQMMAQKGVGMTGTANTVKVCISAEEAARGELPAGDGKCQQKDIQRSGNRIKASFACAGPPPTTGTSEMTLKGDSAYEGRSVIDSTVKGKPERMTVDVSGQWLGASCGEIKPMRR
jgi:Protein of unknown function (DUF3617)